MWDVSNFYEYTLTITHVKVAVCISTVLLTLIAIYGKVFFPETKKLAWIISLFNSGMMLVAGIVYLTVKSSSYVKLFTFEPDRRLFHGIDNFSALVCIWFACANLMDLAFGMIFYRSQLGLITAYFHHTVFIWIMITATTGNGGFITVTRFAPAFAAMLVEELPTFLLALGSVFPSLRTDLGFGISFFALRICLHLHSLVYGLYSAIDGPVVGLYLLTLTMHVNWFYSWVTKYGMKMMKKRSSSSDKKRA